MTDRETEIATTKPSLIATIRGEIQKLKELLQKTQDRPATSKEQQRDQEARQGIVGGRAQLAKLRTEAAQLRRFLTAKETALARWSDGLDDQIQAAERADLNYHDRNQLVIEKLRISHREAVGLIAVTAELEKLARAEQTAAREEADRVQCGRSFEEVIADPPTAEAAAKARLTRATTAVKKTTAEWCSHQRERYRLRTQLAAAEATFSRARSKHQADANRLRETLREGLVARDDALTPHRARLRELTGSDGVEVAS